ncbi:hypothetical protein, partial [Variovorax beijingensis]|uniref:hypothetical protein n=1 Tax=Variovorax beijingensis TaxID=2496117 RepID=UPI003F696500
MASRPARFWRTRTKAVPGWAARAGKLLGGAAIRYAWLRACHISIGTSAVKNLRLKLATAHSRGHGVRDAEDLGARQDPRRASR